MLYRILDFFKRKPVTLWHPSSPGLRVTVRRSPFEELFKPEKSATLGEVIRANKHLRD